jgi:hypothetical protein
MSKDHGGYSVMFYDHVVRDMIMEGIMCAFLLLHFVHDSAMPYKNGTGREKRVGWVFGDLSVFCSYSISIMGKFKSGAWYGYR